MRCAAVVVALEVAVALAWWWVAVCMYAVQQAAVLVVCARVRACGSACTHPATPLAPGQAVAHRLYPPACVCDRVCVCVCVVCGCRFARNGELGTVAPSVRSCVQSQCDAAAKMMFQSGCFNSSPNNPSNLIHYTHLRQVMESYVMEALHEPIFRWLAAWHTEQTARLSRQLSSMMAMTQATMRIKTHFRTDFSAARDKLGELGRYRTPLEKLQCLRDVTELVQVAVEEHLVNIGIDVSA